MHLKTPDGQSAVVVGGSVPAVHDGWMWDLTVPGNNDHDFYVLPSQVSNGRNTYHVVASDTPVLVHNNDPACDVTTGYRTQTAHPDSQRLSVDESGNVTVQGNGYLYVNLSGDIGHSVEFRGADSQIVAFDLPTSYVDELKASAIPQRMPRDWSGTQREWNLLVKSSVQESDRPGLYGIPGSMLGEFQSQIIPGSGQILGGSG